MSNLPSLCPKETAIVVRRLLAKKFPACKFSVRTERGSMVSSVRVSWTDGPSVKAVDAVVGCFEAGSFDGMTDSYNYDRTAFLEIDGVMYRPGCRYLFTSREISPAFATRLVAAVAKFWGGVEVIPTIIDNGFGGWALAPAGIESKQIRADLTGRHNDWTSSIYRAAADRLEVTWEGR